MLSIHYTVCAWRELRLMNTKNKHSGTQRNDLNPEWVVMKSLIDAHEQTMRAMEQCALASLRENRQLSNRELEVCLAAAYESHELALADIEAALEMVDAAED